jgi:general secretion pathway protein K
MTRTSKRSSKGTALLAVLWLTAALSAIAFSIADTVRAETERGISTQESIRAYYLARGAVERTLYQLRNSNDGSGGSPAERFAGRRRLYFQEEFGDTLVELISENGKLPLRGLSPNILSSILLSLGESPESSANIVRNAFSGAAIPLAPTMQNSLQAPSFRLPLASMENVEELLLVPGITSELLYGRYTRLPDGHLINRGGLIDCLSPHVLTRQAIDPFSVHPTLLVALGMDPAAAQRFGEIRRQSFDPVVVVNQLQMIQAGTGSISLRADLGDVFQIRATARVRTPNGTLSDTRRTVSLLLKYITPNPRYMWISPWTHLRWYDQAFSDVASSNTVWRTPLPQSEATQ